jgi:Zn-dependent protease
MKESIRVWKVLGIPIEVHVFFIMLMLCIAFLSVLSLEFGFFVYFLLLFFLVVLHEISHSIVAIFYQVKIEKITLMPFGGIASMEKIPEEPEKELMISLAGPGLNFLLAGLSYVLIVIFGVKILPFFTLKIISATDFLLLFFKTNILLGGFNLIPALPMDGGRILRSLLAFKVGFVEATTIATGTAKILAVFMFAFGLVFNWLLVVVAFFVYIGAQQELETIKISSILKGIKAKDVMSTNVVEVSPDITLEELSTLILKHKHMGYPVTKNGMLIGIVTFTDLAKHPRKEWKEMKVKDVMTKDVMVVSGEDSVMDILLRMTKKNIGRVPVTEERKVIGIVSRTDIIKMAEIKKLEK